MKKGKSVKAGIVIALLLLVVGFAVVSTTLNINGTAKLKGNDDEFAKSIRFVADTDETNKATISSSMEDKAGTVSVSADGKTLTFTTPVLDTKDETATVTYWVENVGDYNAKLGTITCTTESSNATAKALIEVNPSSNYEGLELLKNSRTTEPARIVVRQTDVFASDEEAEVKITCTLPAEAIEK